MRAELNEPVPAEHGLHPSPTVLLENRVSAHRHRKCLGILTELPHTLPWAPGPSAVLAPRARVGVSTGGCFTHHFSEHMVLQERQDQSASGKHPRSQQTPFPHLRKISIFMSLITPLKLLCECSNSKSTTTQRQILRPLGNQQ